MRYLEAKAATTPTTDLGEFEALVAVFGNTDRGGDRIQPGAFAKSISEWREVGRRVPLHFEHDPHVIIGDIDAEEMRESDKGLEVSGRIDLDDDLGRKVWKSLKRGRIAFSFGYLATKEHETEDGVTELIELDLFEVSVTAAPMNNLTRVLSTKSATATEELTEELTESEQQTLDALRREWEAGKAEAKQEEEPHVFVPTRRTRLTYDGTSWTESRDEDPGGATEEQVAAYKQARRREQLQREAIHRARAARAAQQPATFPIFGVKVREGGVIVDPKG